MVGDAFDVEEVDFACAAGPVLGRGAPGPGDRNAARLAVGREARADLEEAHVAPAVTPVVRHDVDQARQERRPQRVELGRQRIGNSDDAIERQAG